MASPPFDPNASIPADTDVIALYPGVERTFRDVVESWLLFEHGRSGHHKLPVISTAARDAITDWEVGSLIYNTNLLRLQITTSIDPDAWVGADVQFPSGTRMIFNNGAAPLGWTKELGDAYHDAAIIGSTTGVSTEGVTGFFQVMGPRTILQAHLPNYVLPVTDPGHVHTNAGLVGTSTWEAQDTGSGLQIAVNFVANPNTSLVGTGIGVSSGGSGATMDFNVKRVYNIFAQKD